MDTAQKTTYTNDKSTIYVECIYSQDTTVKDILKEYFINKINNLHT
jgi:hypothetical protein